MSATFFLLAATLVAIPFAIAVVGWVVEALRILRTKRTGGNS